MVQEQGEAFVKTDLDKLRHSASHIMAQAIQDLYPGTKLAIGPAIKSGFYYDLDSDHQFTEEDLPKIEERMNQIIKEAQPFEQKMLTVL